MSTIAGQLEYVRDAVDAWAKPNGGSAEIARGIIHFFGILGAKPGGFKLAVKFKGEDKRGEFEEANMFDRKFWVAFTYGESLQLGKGDALTKGQAGGQPILDLIEQLREVVRGLQFSGGDTEVTPNYLGCHELIESSPDLGLIDGYYLEFLIGSEAGVPVTQEAQE